MGSPGPGAQGVQGEEPKAYFAKITAGSLAMRTFRYLP